MIVFEGDSFVRSESVRTEFRIVKECSNKVSCFEELRAFERPSCDLVIARGHIPPCFSHSLAPVRRRLAAGQLAQPLKAFRSLKSLNAAMSTC